MAPHTFQNEADNAIAQALLLVLAFLMMMTPFIVSKIANIGRRPWPSRAVEAKPRALLAPPRIAA